MTTPDLRALRALIEAADDVRRRVDAEPEIGEAIGWEYVRPLNDALGADFTALLAAAEDAERYRAALVRLADAAETFAGSDPDMSSHRDAEADFDVALDHARALTDRSEG